MLASFHKCPEKNANITHFATTCTIQKHDSFREPLKIHFLIQQMSITHVISRVLAGKMPAIPELLEVPFMYLDGEL